MKTEIPEDIQREIKSETVKKQKELLADFESFALIKSTIHSLKFDGVYRIQETISEKVIDSLGLVKPMDIEKLQQINEQSEIKHKIALQLGEIVTIPLKDLNNQPVVFRDGYTLVKSWSLGVFMNDFEVCRSISGIQLMGLISGDVNTYQKVIKANEWDHYDHILDSLDLQFDEQTQEFRSVRLSAMLLYNGVLIYKKYAELQPDGEEVVKDVLGLIENGIREAQQYQIVRESVITQSEYQRLKKIIINLRKQKFSRDVEITITKKTIYRKEEKEVYYEQPIIKLNSSPKAQSLTDKLAASLGKQNINWDSKLLKNKICEIIKEYKLNVNIALEKDIIILVNQRVCQVAITPWEEGILMPYYQNSGYMHQFRQWIHAAESIKFEFNENPVLERINEMILRLFTQVPKVEKVINEIYHKICFVEKWRPPYEELENIRFEEIKRKSNKVLLVWLFDYENDEDVERLKELIKISKANPQYELQIAILGYLRFESWTKLFFHFMQKHDLNKEVLDSTIETWFPQQEKFGDITFSVLLYKMYGLLLDKKDIMIVDAQGYVRFIDSNRVIIPNIVNFIEKCNIKVKPATIQNQQQFLQFKQLLEVVLIFQKVCQGEY